MDGTVSDLHGINARLRASAMNRWLGVQAVSVSAQEVRLRVPWRAEFEGVPGRTHGGVFASIIDAAAYAALLGALGGSGPTVDMRVDFHANAGGGALDIGAHVLRAGGRISTVEVQVCDGNGRLLASGRCVFLGARHWTVAPTPPVADECADQRMLTGHQETE